MSKNTRKTLKTFTHKVQAHAACDFIKTTNPANQYFVESVGSKDVKVQSLIINSEGGSKPGFNYINLHTAPDPAGLALAKIIITNAESKVVATQYFNGVEKSSSPSLERMFNPVRLLAAMVIRNLTPVQICGAGKLDHKTTSVVIEIIQ